jgi:hypothetical protein
MLPAAEAALCDMQDAIADNLTGLLRDLKQEIKPAAVLAELSGAAVAGHNGNTANVDQKEVNALTLMAKEVKDRAQTDSMLP